jgi:phenylacetate-CoA ligase
MTFLRLYHQMPAWTRSLIASAHGAYLERWRYGSDTERLVEEALERETWSPARWSAWREERLALILHRAASQVPFYRDLWARRRRNGYKGSYELLENWPILEKNELRSNATAFLADDVSRKHMFQECSSGSTGTPVNLWFSRQTLQFWYALFEARWRRWYGVSRFSRWAILGGQLVTPVAQAKPPFWVWNSAMRQLYMSSYHLSSAYVSYYIDAIERYRIEYLWGYTSSLYSLAQVLLNRGRPGVRLRVAISNAEPLFAHQRDTIAAAFDCPVKETYGMSEIVAGASECEHGALHLWPEVGHVEIEPDEISREDEITGQIIATGLCNPDMPLIRYRVSDRASLPLSSSGCSCGRTLPLVSRIEGRSDDVLFTIDGRVIGRLDPVFKGDFLVQEAQIIQESLTVVRLRYVPAPGCAERQIQSMAEQIRARIGDVQVRTECVSAIPRGPNNKFRAVVCRLPLEQRRSLMQIRV